MHIALNTAIQFNVPSEKIKFYVFPGDKKDLTLQFFSLYRQTRLTRYVSASGYQKTENVFKLLQFYLDIHMR